MLEDGPHTLYRIYADPDGEALLYIGISASWPRRMTQHQTSKDWFGETGRVDVEAYPDRASALAAEEAAIKAEKPLYNIIHNTARVKVEVSAEIPLSAESIFYLVAAALGMLLLGRWAADVFSAWWVRRRGANEGIPVQLPPARNPFTEEPPSTLLQLFYGALAVAAYRQQQDDDKAAQAIAAYHAQTRSEPPPVGGAMDGAGAT
jgi:predicted GIY-YIG superfamily endonuclease